MGTRASRHHQTWTDRLEGVMILHTVELAFQFVIFDYDHCGTKAFLCIEWIANFVCEIFEWDITVRPSLVSRQTLY